MEAFLSDDDEDYDLNLEDEEKLLEEESDKKSKSENEESDILDLELAEEDKMLANVTANSSMHEKHNKTSKFTKERASPVQYEDRNNKMDFKAENSEKPAYTNRMPQKRPNFNYNNRPQKFNNQNRGKFNNRGNNYARKTENSKNIHVNPRFAGSVQVNNNARLRWDSQNNVQQPIACITPWQTDNPPQNVPQRMVQAIQPQVQQNYQPMIQPFHQQIPFSNVGTMAPLYNQIPPSFNENRQVLVPQQQHMIGQMQPPVNQQVFNQPPQYYNMPIQTPDNVRFMNQVHQNYPQWNSPPNMPITYNQCAPYPNNNNSGFCNMPMTNTAVYNQPVCDERVPAFESPSPVNECRQVNVQYQRQNNKMNSNYSPQKRFVPKKFEPVKKRRRTDTANLQEVKTVELPKQDQKMVVEEPEVDEETKEYLKKIELQKKKRLEFLRQKEERRRKQAESIAAASSVHPMQVENTQTTEVQMNKQNTASINNSANNVPPSINVHIETDQQQPISVIGGPQRIVSIKNPNVNNNNKVIALKKPNAVPIVSNTNPFLKSRTVLARDDSLVNTPFVVVKNLSAGTTENRIRKMCTGIGDVQVRFKNQ